MLGIKIKSDDTLEAFEYNGLESMQKAVGGYIELVGVIKINNVECCLFCNEEFLFINTDECKRYNPVATAIAPFETDLYGDCIILADDSENCDCRGFTEEEYRAVEGMLLAFITLNREKLKLLHIGYDRKGVI